MSELTCPVHGPKQPEPCECPVAGWCEKFKRNMSEYAHSVCSGAAGKPAEHVYRYQQNWGMISRNGTPKPIIKAGPGTELKAIIEWWGFTYSASCNCENHAREMDWRGCDWCEENLETIVGWLREGAAARGFPFLELAARRWVKLAIKRARLKAISENR